MQGIISTDAGDFDKEKFDALIEVRARTLEGLRAALLDEGYREVTTASLVNVAGSCENPQASFKLDYYGKETHLSQSAQLQLEALVIRLQRGFFAVNNSFREEHFEDPEAKARRLSEFTLVEAERPYEGLVEADALEKLIREEERVVRRAVSHVLGASAKSVDVLGGDLAYLSKVLVTPFNRITYNDALSMLSAQGSNYSFGHDLDIRDERRILQAFDNVPTFVTYFPASIKFFNMKRTDDGQRVYSVDLLMPKLGEASGGALREQDGEKIKEQLRESRIGRQLASSGIDPIEPFREYFKVFEQESPCLRGGYGIGFERFIGFLIGSNDILNTIAYESMTSRVQRQN